MSNNLSRLARHRFNRRKGDTSQLAAQLAPLEEQKKVAEGTNGLSNSLAHQEIGAIVVEGDAARLSQDLAEVREDSGRRPLEPVVLVIVILMLIWIVFIAWQVSIMPEK